jgi:hypothetical protein
MKALKLIMFLTGVIVIISLGCRKEKDTASALRVNAKGLVLFAGDPSVDGCGWLIQIDTINYSPIILDSEFKKDSLHILVDYELLNSKFRCGWREPGLSQIEIKKIINQ